MSETDTEQIDPSNDGWEYEVRKHTMDAVRACEFFGLAASAAADELELLADALRDDGYTEVLGGPLDLPDTDKGGLNRLDESFLKNLYVALTGDGTGIDPNEMREYLVAEFGEEEIQSIIRSYLLCLSVPETVRRLDATEASSE